MTWSLRALILALGTVAAFSPALAQTPDEAPPTAPDLTVRPEPDAVVQQPPTHHSALKHRAVHHPRSAKRTHAVKAVHIDQLKEAEKHGFRKVNDLLPAFPPFYPGLGIVTVDPKTLPMGPFRCFDRAGNLVATVYMPTMADMESHKTWDKVPGVAAPVDHVTQYFHPGHPGVQVPHYHVVLWHVKNEAVVAK